MGIAGVLVHTWRNTKVTGVSFSFKAAPSEQILKATPKMHDPTSSCLTSARPSSTFALYL